MLPSVSSSSDPNSFQQRRSIIDVLPQDLISVSIIPLLQLKEIFNLGVVSQYFNKVILLSNSKYNHSLSFLNVHGIWNLPPSFKQIDTIKININLPQIAPRKFDIIHLIISGEGNRRNYEHHINKTTRVEERLDLFTLKCLNNVQTIESITYQFIDILNLSADLTYIDNYFKNATKLKFEDIYGTPFNDEQIRWVENSLNNFRQTLTTLTFVNTNWNVIVPIIKCLTKLNNLTIQYDLNVLNENTLLQQNDDKFDNVCGHLNKFILNSMALINIDKSKISTVLSMMKEIRHLKIYYLNDNSVEVNNNKSNLKQNHLYSNEISSVLAKYQQYLITIEIGVNQKVITEIEHLCTGLVVQDFEQFVSSLITRNRTIFLQCLQTLTIHCVYPPNNIRVQIRDYVQQLTFWLFFHGYKYKHGSRQFRKLVMNYSYSWNVVDGENYSSRVPHKLYSILDLHMGIMWGNRSIKANKYFEKYKVDEDDPNYKYLTESQPKFYAKDYTILLHPNYPIRLSNLEPEEKRNSLDINDDDDDDDDDDNERQQEIEIWINGIDIQILPKILHEKRPKTADHEAFSKTPEIEVFDRLQWKTNSIVRIYHDDDEDDDDPKWCYGSILSIDDSDKLEIEYNLGPKLKKNDDNKRINIVRLHRKNFNIQPLEWKEGEIFGCNDK